MAKKIEAEPLLSGRGRRPIDDRLFAFDAGGMALVGGRCAVCSTLTFPVQTSCPRCGRPDQVRETLPREGTLWTYTVQAYQPKSPFRASGDFEPFGVGYVHLGDVIVESRLSVNDPHSLCVGSPMTLVEHINHIDDDGAEVITFAFAPRTAHVSEEGR